MAKYTNIGSVSSGTMRTQDLLPCFLDVLSELNKVEADRLQQQANEALYDAWLDASLEDVEGSMSDILSDVIDALNSEAPPYFYFGAHPGDGADFGFWLSEEFEREIEDSDGLKVNTLFETPVGFCGEVLQVSDHGNPSLYLADGKGGFEELWAVV